jgi:peptidylprolyl isomerase
MVLAAAFVPVAAPPARAASTADLLEAIDRIEDARWDSAGALVRLASDADPVVRRRAVIALGRLQERSALPVLFRALRDSVEAVAVEAAFAAGQMADSSDVDTLSRALGAGGEDFRVEVAAALGKTKSRRASKHLIGILGDPSARVRGEAALGLAALGDSAVASYLFGLVSDADPGVRWRALFAIEKTGDSTAVWVVANALGDADALVRSFAARALGKLRTRKAVVPLTYPQVLADPDWRVRVNAARSLGQTRDRGAARALGPMKDDPVVHVRAAAAEALGEISHPLVLGALLPFLSDPAGPVRSRAGEADLKIEKAAGIARVLPLLSDPDAGVRARAAGALGFVKGSDVAREQLYRFAADPQARLRAAAMQGLGDLGDRAAAPVLLNGLEDEDPVVASLAASGLAAVGDSSFTQVGALYERGLAQPSVDMRLAAVEALAALRAPGGRPVLEKALADEDYRVRKAAREGLKPLVRKLPAEPKRAPLAAAPRPYEGVPQAGPRHATLRTAGGEVRLELFADDAPHTVANFVRLARDGFFSGRSFHRVVPNFVVQDGCPRGDGWGDPGYTIRCEINRRRFVEGTVGMALSGKDTGGSQYFITHSPQPHLDGRYTVFGRVIAGQEIVDSLIEGDAIEAVVVEE